MFCSDVGVVTMTTDMQALKTNEFLRRRKLRLQQVREQSKDIAKKVRQRAKVEKQRHIGDLDVRKEKEYLVRQEKLVQQLEELYAKGIQNVGSSHRSATNLRKDQENIPPNLDLSKVRGREAASILRHEKEQHLLKQKTLLARKAQARETANVISREKLKTTSKLLDSKTIVTDKATSKNIPSELVHDKEQSEPVDVLTSKVNMGTQFNFKELPREWAPSVPILTLSNEDTEPNNDSGNSNQLKAPPNTRRMDLFAVSEEMPNSLRNSSANRLSDDIMSKPSLSLVSEYLQTRNLRLREPDINQPKIKKTPEDFQSLKQTIQKARSTQCEGTISDICYVHDHKVIPVPSWHAIKCENCVCKTPQAPNFKSSLYTDTISSLNKARSFVKNHQTEQALGLIKEKSASRRLTYSSAHFCRAKGVKAATGDPIKTNLPEDAANRKAESAAAKKSSVTVYNHSTRDTRAMLFPSDLHVSRDQPEEDAYSQAIRESMTDERDREHEKKLKDMRSKIAMSKQCVEKEYKDTMSFLNSMPVEMRTGRPIKQAFMDDKRQQKVQEDRQRRMNHEFSEIEKECRRRSAMTKPKPCSKRPKSKSADRNVELDAEEKDVQYSWMPVPDNDEAMAVHTIPVTLKEGKNCVKFSKVDSYHEYRSRHKHTPPTKDVPRDDDDNGIETMVSDVQDVTDSSDSDSSEQSIAIQTKHVKKTRETRKQTRKQDLSDSEKIIVYKIIESKEKARKKSAPHVTTLFSGDDKGRGDAERLAKDNNENVKTTTSQFTEKHYGDMYNTTADKTGSVASTSVTLDVNKSQTVNNRTTTRECFCGKSRRDDSDKTVPLYQWERSDGATTHIQRNSMENVPSESKQNEVRQTHVTATSSSSFKTAAAVQNGQAVHDGLMKLVDEAGKEAGNFYIGTSGFLRDKDYEVIIKLRKKDTNEEMLNTDRVQSKAGSLETRKETISSDDRLTVIENKIDSPIPSMPFETTETRGGSKDHESNPDSVKKSAEIQTVSQAHANTSYAFETTPKNANGTQSSQNNRDQSSAVNQQGQSTPGESNPKLLTSACTQTTLLSPVRPPILFHLSSSTSTSYMSPPEIILPTFLESFPSEYVDQDHPRHEHRKHSCKCKKYTDSKKRSVESDDPEKKSSCELRSNKCKKHKHVQKQSKENLKLSAKSSDEEPCRCRKCVSAKPSKTYALMKRYSRKFMYSKSKDLKRGIKSTRLNPALKSYVNKLLELNREGMRIMDVVGQDCSDVTTPASSIVNVDGNVDAGKSLSNNRISLDRIGKALLKNMASQHESKPNLSLGKHIGRMTTENELETLFLKHFPRLMRRRSSVHKIRTLNISKKLISISSTNESPDGVHPSASRTSSSKPSPHERSATQMRTRSNSSPTPRYTKDNEDVLDRVVNFKEIDSTELTKHINDIKSAVKDINISKVTKNLKNNADKKKDEPLGTNNNLLRSQVDNEKMPEIRHHSMLTQTEDLSSNKTNNSENKVQNMKIIAHLTDKCTKRLSNLAKVLNEVRKNKSLAYSQISTQPSSDSQPRLEKSSADKSNAEQMRSNREYIENEAQPGSTSPSEEDAFVKSADYMYILEGIPKPRSPLLSSPTKSSKSSGDESNLSRDQIIKLRNRPPTALSRINLRNGEDYIIPHELSTVLEVDSPMSIRVKSITKEVNESHSTKNIGINDSLFNPDNRGKSIAGTSSTTATTKLSSFGKSKMEIMDIKKFNEIMLKPYISIDEFAKQCHINRTEEIENDGPPKNTSDNNSMPSEGSLPDVINELLKRNVITEPFKFDTASNINSITFSSESSVSGFAIPKVHGDKKTSNLLLFHQKGNDVAETSDTMSISSNPELEMAFDNTKLRWASSTLKKTKESQALSTSSNTSSSSQHRNAKSSAMPKASKETASFATSPKSKRFVPPKSVEQQTSITNSMTVKEFLTNELSKQITFSNKSIRRNETEELVSMYETNMNGEPHSPTINRTVESDRNTNRARTSTPVQIYKSPTYKSSSSSNTNNTSNGLFGNVDELSSVKLTSGSFKNNSTSDKDDLTIPNFSLKLKRNSELSKSD